MARCKKCFKKVSECKCGETELLDPEVEAEVDKRYRTIKVILELCGVKEVRSE